MNVIFDAADNHRLTIEPDEDSTEILMQFLAQGLVAQEWAAIFGGENRVNQYLCERLWHGLRMPEWRI